jgi:hypothetical protein
MSLIYIFWYYHSQFSLRKNFLLIQWSYLGKNVGNFVAQSVDKIVLQNPSVPVHPAGVPALSAAHSKSCRDDCRWWHQSAVSGSVGCHKCDAYVYGVWSLPVTSSARSLPTEIPPWLPCATYAPPTTSFTSIFNDYLHTATEVCVCVCVFFLHMLQDEDCIQMKSFHLTSFRKCC